MPSSLSRWTAVGVLIASLSFGASSCLDDSRFRVGYATFFVEFYDPVIDRFGVLQLAYCARNLTFAGQIDTACIELPMVYSFGMDAFVTCTYFDAAGVPWTYTDLFYFWPGYIQEPACFDGFDAPDDEPVMNLARDTTLSRDGDGRVRIEEIQEGITLSSEQASLDDLRSEALDETVEVVDSLPDDQLADEPIRVGDTQEGDPPEGINDLPLDSEE